MRQNAVVLIATEGRSAALLRQEFPALTFISLPGYNISYPEKGNMLWAMTKSLPGILKGVKEEHQQLQKVIAEHQIDGIISDNRYGLHSNKIPSVFITHQLNIPSPVFKSAVNQLNKSYIDKFDQCWVPDFENHLLSGQLSVSAKQFKHLKFIGSLSRFSSTEKKSDPSVEVLGIVSGPEPQRSIFENILRSELGKLNKKSVLILGRTEENHREQIGNCEVMSHASTKEFRQLLQETKYVVSRSGYSTLMDLFQLQKKAIFVPTPGQPEQEYLSKYLMENKLVYSVDQKNFDLQKALEISEQEHFSGFNNSINNSSLLKTAITDFLQSIEH